MEASRYLSIVTRLFLKRYWWCLALPVLAFVVLAVLLADIRFLLVALIVTFAAIPALLPLIYYYYALAPEAIVRRRVSRGCMLLMLDDRRLRFLAVPLTAFDGEQQLRDFITTLTSK